MTILKNQKNGNENWKFVVLVVTLVLVTELIINFMPSFVRAQTIETHTQLTVPQVDAIIGLLRAFGVDEPTVSKVYSYLSSPSVPPTTVGGSTPVVQASVAQPPVCTLSTVVQGSRAQLWWTFTPGAMAVVTENGVPLKLSYWLDPGVPHFITGPDSRRQQALFGPMLTGTTTYEMDVSLGGLTGNCSTQVNPN